MARKFQLSGMRAPMRARWLSVATFLLGLALAPLALAQDLVPVPPLAGRVTDVLFSPRISPCFQC